MTLLDDAALPLDAHPIFRTVCPEELRSFLGDKSFDFTIDGSLDPASGVDTRINAVYLPNIELTYVQLGAPATAGADPERGDFRIQIPIRGAAQTSAGPSLFACARGQGAITSPTHYQRIQMTEDCRRLLVILQRATLVQQLGVLAGRPVSRPLAFRPELDMTRGPGGTLAALVRFAVREFGREGSAFLNPLARAQFEQLFITTLLLGQPHTCSDLLEAPDRQIVPRDVKRAVDYIHANLDQPITIADLVAACGVPGRTLRKHFQDFRGLSPMAYVRQQRLEQARADLLEFDGNLRIADVAQRWGFEHLGRFSVAYRKAYGESPSQTAYRSMLRL